MTIVKNAAALLIGCLLFGVACSLGSSAPLPTPTPVPPATVLIAVPTIAPTSTPQPTDQPPVAVNPTLDPSLIIINLPGIAPDYQCNIVPLYIGSAVNIRSGPDTTYRVIGLLENYVQFVGISGNWYQLSLPGGGTGWVSNTVTRLVGKCGPPTNTPQFIPSVTPSPQCTITTTVSTTSYLLPSFTGGVFTVLPAQYSVQATFQTNDGWFGYDPGIPQADRQGLYRLRWLPAGNPAGNSMIRSPGCQFIPTVTVIIPTLATPGVCTITTTGETAVYMQPNFNTIFGSLPPGSIVKATARTIDGWYGFDPGVAQADSQGLDRLRWVPAGNPAGNTMTTSAGCATLTTVSYP